jgi:RNAse (barnase) inhibitor barstar
MTTTYINDQICVVRINGSRILTWQSFHSYFQREFGFPEFYGRNIDAWIDCMGDLDKPENRMSTFTVKKGQMLVFHLTNVDELKSKAPDIYYALMECSAHINRSRMGSGELPLLALSF